jgi:hypothetical protein
MDRPSSLNDFSLPRDFVRQKIRLSEVAESSIHAIPQTILPVDLCLVRMSPIWFMVQGHYLFCSAGQTLQENRLEIASTFHLLLESQEGKSERD